MRMITVEPEELENAALRMEEANEHYRTAFHQLFQAVDTMKSSWQGKDNLAFSTKIRSFEADFNKMSVLCAQYSDFLRSSARAYRDTQDSLAMQAEHLGE